MSYCNYLKPVTIENNKKRASRTWYNKSTLGFLVNNISLRPITEQLPDIVVISKQTITVILLIIIKSLLPSRVVIKRLADVTNYCAS
jgi:hypothetical protein